MSILDLFKTIQSSHFAHFIGSQNHLFGAFLQLLHITGLILVLTSIILVALNLLGTGLRRQPAGLLADSTEKLIWSGLGLLAVSGLLIFIPAATNYYKNPAFWSKFALLATAVVIHKTLYWHVTHNEDVSPTLAKFTGILILLLWFSVAFAARFIGFV